MINLTQAFGLLSHVKRFVRGHNGMRRDHEHGHDSDQSGDPKRPAQNPPGGLAYGLAQRMHAAFAPRG